MSEKKGQNKLSCFGPGTQNDDRGYHHLQTHFSMQMFVVKLRKRRAPHLLTFTIQQDQANEACTCTKGCLDTPLATRAKQHYHDQSFTTFIRHLDLMSREPVTWIMDDALHVKPRLMKGNFSKTSPFFVDDFPIVGNRGG